MKICSECGKEITDSGRKYCANCRPIAYRTKYQTPRVASQKGLGAGKLTQHIRNKLRAWRSQGMSYAEMARRVGVSEEAIEDYCTGKTYRRTGRPRGSGAEWVRIQQQYGKQWIFIGRGAYHKLGRPAAVDLVPAQRGHYGHRFFIVAGSQHAVHGSEQNTIPRFTISRAAFDAVGARFGTFATFYNKTLRTLSVQLDRPVEDDEARGAA